MDNMHFPGIELTVVIPAWNEEGYIYRTINEIIGTFAEEPIEVIIVDDGSVDATGIEVHRWIDNHQSIASVVRYVKLPRNQGKGVAIKTGVMHSKGRFVSFIDADLEIPPRDLARLYKSALKEVVPKVLIGTKDYLNHKSFLRRCLSISFRTVVSTLFKLPVSDTQTGCKVFPGNWLRDAMPQTKVDRYLMDLELIVMASSVGVAVEEIEVQYTSIRPLNRVHFVDIYRCITELFMIYFTHRHSPIATYVDQISVRMDSKEKVV